MSPEMRSRRGWNERSLPLSGRESSAKPLSIDVGVAYSASIDAVRKVLDATAAGIEGRDPEKGHAVVLPQMDLHVRDLHVSQRPRIGIGG